MAEIFQFFKRYEKDMLLYQDLSISGLLFNDGSPWKSHRRFTLKSLRDFGFGKSSLEHVLVEEADRMGEYFIEQKSQPFLVQSLFNLVILNVLWTIVAGKR